MIPEGLVLLTSTVLAVSVIRLSKRKVLVQDLYCIETLARVDILCLDKTGTITEGKMEVKDIIPINENVEKIEENNCKVGLSIKPETKIEEIYEFLPYIHMCLIMTVEPGKGGQTLLTDMVDKISKLKKYVDENKLEIDIEADGGINLKTAESVKNAGANILVSGTAILIAKDYKTIIDELRK